MVGTSVMDRVKEDIIQLFAVFESLIDIELPSNIK